MAENNSGDEGIVVTRFIHAYSLQVIDNMCSMPMSNDLI